MCLIGSNYEMFPTLMKLKCLNDYCITLCGHVHLKFVKTYVKNLDFKVITDRHTTLVEDIEAWN